MLRQEKKKITQVAVLTDAGQRLDADDAKHDGRG